MAEITIVDKQTIKIGVSLKDAIKMVTEASRDIPLYAFDIITIYEKMPVFEYTYFCFYAYDSATLFEYMLDIDPKQYNSFSLDAPDSFFYALYGGMAALYEQAKQFHPVAIEE
ncbi:hypothetical protein [Paenibacillus crassostreae]|uniref:Uncharacterized protein n=1 Tax=Paenibacillus crassostreae TaxID=1763538 RepID=A0A167DG98_9BACL|nr:hypothetical protein [Paenibacillus crassostreae]AOZ91507.1 hypothetical protein LPB68_04295 [Paenibacillus crassostreae]OAB74334.1 hypothetical protein PNBC_09665 [Paenibacillus crassostreae]